MNNERKVNIMSRIAEGIARIKSIEIMKKIITHFGGGWIDKNV